MRINASYLLNVPTWTPRVNQIPWAFIRSFTEAPQIKSLIFYYFSPIHVYEITQALTFLLSYQFVIQTRHLGFKIVQLILLSSSQILPIGQKVQDPLCEKCSFPILVYGRLVCITSIYLCTRLINYQRAKKVVSDSPVTRLVDFNIVIRLVNFVLNLLYWQTSFFQEIHITEEL